MKKFLFTILSLIITISVYAGDDSKVYCLAFGEELANNGYVKSTFNMDDDNNIVTIKLIGDWEAISAGKNDIHQFPKLTLDRILISWPKEYIVNGWTQSNGHLYKQIRLQRNMIEFDIPIGHDVVYIHEYIDKYPANVKNTQKSKKRTKRTNKRK